MTQRHYYFAIGSNIAPEQHVPPVIDAFAGVFGEVVLGRLFRTEPVGVVLEKGAAVSEPVSSRFLNACFAVTVDEIELTRDWCVTLGKVMEIQHGRPLDQPDRRHSSRTVDIDYLFSSADAYQAQARELEVYSSLDLDRLLNHFEGEVPSGLTNADNLLEENSVHLETGLQPLHFKQQQSIRFLW
ncbi:MAG: 2-amino-4-hydroxy-6-hydroxymethyldihydropteridine diphosphokinase [Natronospirillum sp.]|uniref:2-amino-4-hydroxy-6- hydroxymethyldihydropteridine diphosphokinase n=1 Tax=Natronospirillum sp. TaxID=2812955 RepID=UPI0025EBACB0|nr:2-amino-4-hydroxy-6-hydroxymethyldihydropteridine diphosphokinase [Natronospirillum sp.]MCH8550917.1 2-amino-4-hydroxy-6-hydroxymethyldihydropteridine diphosphokinase [Natronospirillum sp.]